MKSILLAGLVGLAATPSASAAETAPDCEREAERRSVRVEQSTQTRAAAQPPLSARSPRDGARRNATAIPDAELIGRHTAL